MSTMTPRVNPNEGFPHDRVHAAKMYLYSIKPWWARFGERMVVVPTYTVPRGDAQWGAMTSTDQHLRLYVDRTFATVAPLHLLAGAIEHEYQHHVHDTWRRLQWMEPDEWRNWANIVLDLEINSAIDAESQRLDFNQIHSALKESTLFTQKDIRIWSVTEPPGIGDTGWIPRVVGLPNGLSAEEYYRLIHKPEGAHDNETASDDSGEDEESQRDSDGEQGDTSPNDEDAEVSGAKSENQDGEQGEEPSEDSPKIGSDQEASGSSSGEDEGESEPESGDGRSDPNDDPSQSESANPEDSDSEDGSESSGDGSDQGQSQSGEANQPGEEPGDADSPSANVAGGASPSPSPAEIIEEMRSDPINQMWASEIENPSDPLSNPAWKPSEPPPPPSLIEIAEALAELEEDIHSKRSLVPGFGLNGNSRIAKWADEYRRVRKQNWEAVFAKLFLSSVNSARMHGQTDMSYAVRNPNQPVLGPIMMGMHSYSPVIYILQDISGSMLIKNAMKRAQTVFADVCQTVTGNSDSSITWFTADHAIRDVGKTTRWSEDLKRRWSYGFGGTDFGGVIDEIMQGKLVHEGKRYPKPDLLIVSTDCLFDWPKIRPRGSKILVVNVGDAMRAEPYLPKWLNRKREFVQVD